MKAQKNETKTEMKTEMKSDTKDAKDTKTEASEPRVARYKEVFVVEDIPGRRSRWTKVGVAFENRDGSFNLRLSAVPVAGNKLHIRDPEPRAAEGDDGQPVAA